ncbi:Vms1/Ankzf1 family peptidyl-tRNA hydrolase [Brevibacterium sp.]|uniref:baeRF2 domain-containing protein n=1 Tax=Brevibacterium sp. TaxID=1701 RepID=UPI002810D173|nr:Vms1/Ankzf1 family peptidyl-tRNA hydrolase [Brevibacterium sp.]
MKLDELRPVFDAQGPFATVYLEGRTASADASQQLHLRWQELRDDLEGKGADNGLLSSIDSALLGDAATEVHTDGRIIVANASGVLLDEHWDAAQGTGDAAYLSDVPELGTYLREKIRLVDVVLVIADQKGALIRELTIGEDQVTSQAEETQVTGDEDENIHKPRGQGFSHNQIRRHADELIKENARDVAEFVDDLVTRRSPDAVVIAGEVQGRTAVKAEFSAQVRELVHEVTEGGIVDEAAEEALDAALRSLASDLSRDRMREAEESLSQGLAHALAVEGRTEVTKAVERGVVDTLLLSRDASADGEGQLIAGAVRSSAEVRLIDADISDGVAATLRFDASAALAD